MVVFNTKKDQFLIQHSDFNLKEQVEYPNGGISRFYDNGNDMVIIDEAICHYDAKTPVFSYMLITDKQNRYMHEFGRVFRFLGYNKQMVDKYLNHREDITQVDYRITVGDRAEQADVSPLELHFESNFTNVYGMNALKYLSREYGICDETGNNYFLDYFVRTSSDKIAVEENGVSYHHPQIIGEEQYRKQLSKQNTCAIWGIKLYRFSTEDCSFDSRIEDDIKQYFGKDPSSFVSEGLKIERSVELYEHQSVSLDEIKNRRENGVNAFLVVLPTAAGKSKIVEGDIKEFSKGKNDFRGLVLVPGTRTKADWEERDYSLSYKMPFLLAFMNAIDSIGDAEIDHVLEDYIAFYIDRLNRNLQVDRSTCPYNQTTLLDKKAIRQNMLTNPFEKFERKRFLYYSKDLNVMSMNHALFSQMNDADWSRVREQMQDDLANYYAGMGGL